ncbi:hypothetical protein B1H18_23440 [Streptomyces tsukubensis]|uniref:Uncharacterized protein n=1 Tax=Streptomyces tsukubensis TaxID=83656 RepID=A0A1V4A4Y6_9ACTN|nr:hypothetical protein B1H18_23440 [Streptomyces tsukubensis]
MDRPTDIADLDPAMNPPTRGKEAPRVPAFTGFPTGIEGHADNHAERELRQMSARLHTVTGLP